MTTAILISLIGTVGYSLGWLVTSSQYEKNFFVKATNELEEIKESLLIEIRSERELNYQLRLEMMKRQTKESAEQ